METVLVLNGTEIDAPVDDQERLMLDLAAGRIGRSHLIDWLHRHLRPLAESLPSNARDQPPPMGLVLSVAEGLSGAGINENLAAASRLNLREQVGEVTSSPVEVLTSLPIKLAR